jgi:arylsulfatase
MNNLLGPGATQNTILGVSVKTLVSRLDGLLLVLKSCQADSCRKPWRSLFPGGSVVSLIDAVAPAYDGFFEKLPRVSFSACVPGYVVSYEGPQFQSLSLSRRRSGVTVQDGGDPDWALMT